MTLSLTRRLFLGGIGATSALLLSGCHTVPKTPKEEWKYPVIGNIGSRVTPATPVNAKRIAISTLDAFSDKGIFFFDDDRGAQFRIKEKTRQKNTYLVEENYVEGEPHGFTWGTCAVAVLKNGRRVQPEHPATLTVAPDGHIILNFRDDKSLELHVQLEAYDISGEPIRNYLRTRANMPTTAALFLSGETFPAGSVAYAATLWVEKDEILTPSATAFTGSETLEDFSKRYMKETPMCMRSLPGRDVQAIGLLFDRPIKAKKVRNRGRWIEAAQSGKVRIYPTKRGTIFCQKASTEKLGNADWALSWINGTRTLSITIPDGMDPLSFGMSVANRHCLLPAFSEESKGSGRRRNRQVIPTYLWKKSCRIRDAQFRFNSKAAEAIEKALAESQPRRDTWEKENESEVTKRARAIQAKKAAGKARHI